jgi:hypothetical protein
MAEELVSVENKGDWRSKSRRNRKPNARGPLCKHVAVILGKEEYEGLFLFAQSTERTMSGAVRFAIKRLLANQ